MRRRPPAPAVVGAVTGLCDVAKGAVGALLAGRDRPVLAAVASGAAMAGHNWSPWLRGADGRRVSVALGSLLLQAWPGYRLRCDNDRAPA